MSFIMPELVVESILRDGFGIIKDSLTGDKDVVTDIFGDFKSDHLARYYGDSEINKIKELVRRPIQIIHGYPVTDIKPPLIAINLLSTAEVEPYSSFDDFKEESDETIEGIEIISEFDADGYNSATGMISCNFADPDLSAVRTNQIFVDGDGNEFKILGGITNDEDEKHFFIERNKIVNIENVKIISGLRKERTVVRAIRTSENILLSISSEQALITKYITTFVEYILNSSKEEMIRRGLEISSFDVSDFSRAEMLPENLFTRFITLRAKFVEHSWNAENATIIDFSEYAIKVKRDLYKRDNEDELTIRTVVDED